MAIRITGLFVFSIGGLGLWLCLWVSDWDIERSRWPVTKAKVVEMDTRSTSDSEGLRLEIPYAKLEYDALGRHYRQNVNVGLATNVRSSLDAARREFTVGREVTLDRETAPPARPQSQEARSPGWASRSARPQVRWAAPRHA